MGLHQFLVLTVVLFSCRATQPSLVDRSVDLAYSYEPRVIEVLGTMSSHPKIHVIVSPLDKDVMGAVNEERDTMAFSPILSIMVDDALAWVVVHELTHIHRSGYWTQLPEWLEEGVAESVSAILLPKMEPILTKFQTPKYRAGYAYVQDLGLEQVRNLCIKSLAEGYEQIPEAWLPNGWIAEQ